MNQVNPNNMNKNIPTNNIQQYYESRPHKAEKCGKKDGIAWMENS